MSDTQLIFEKIEAAPCPRSGCGYNTYMKPEYVDAVHPHHSQFCVMHPNNAWPGYHTVRLDRCSPEVGYHEPQNCLGCNYKRRYAREQARESEVRSDPQ